MTNYGLLLLFLAHSVHQTDALRHGIAPLWIQEKFCKFYQGMRSLPWDCGGFLHCTSSPVRTNGSWLPCPGGLHFDERTLRCSPLAKCPTGKEVAERLCPRDPSLKFPHHGGCALYYDCSQIQAMENFGLSIYENECAHPMLFDPERGECRDEKLSPVNCDKSRKPKTRCDYRKEKQNCGTADAAKTCRGLANGFYPKPGSAAFSQEYIRCTDGRLSGRDKCKTGSVFDPVQRHCSSNITESVKDYCTNNPLAVFPDTKNCAGYYNCSQSVTYVNMDPYRTECIYTELFDVTKLKCVEYDKLSSPCGSRFEPIDPCDYKVGHCIGRKYCLLCDARCKGKDDGPNPYPTFPNTRFYLLCRGGRATEIMTCNETQIYSHRHKYCVDPGDIAKEPSTMKTATELTTMKSDPTTLQPDTTTTKQVPTTTTPKSTTVTPEPTTKISTTQVPDLTTMEPTTKEPTVTPPSECTCLEELSLLTGNLKNLSSFIDTRSWRFEAAKPYKCDDPPRIQNSVMTMSYEFDLAVASYSCDEGYSACDSHLRSTCKDGNNWDQSSLGECVKTWWANTNNVTLPCKAQMNSALVFKGRSVGEKYSFSLLNNTSGQTYLYVLVSSVSVSAGTTSQTLTTVTLPKQLTGEVTWAVEFKSDTFEISVDGIPVITVHTTAASTLLTTLTISEEFEVQNVKFYHDGYPSLSSEKRWSPFSCPHPPLVDGASVHLSYTHFEAIATYTCDGTDVMCTGNDVIRCSNETGWNAAPGVCIKTVLDARIGGSLPDFPVCPMSLGSGITLWATPTGNKGYLELKSGADTVLRINLNLQNTAKPIALNHVLSDVSSPLIHPPANPFTQGKESHIVIIALTDHLLIEVDGEVFYKYPVDQVNVHKAVLVQSLKAFQIRKARVYPKMAFDATKESVEDNLALNADVESSSSYANPEPYAVDGNPSQAWPTGSCWNADIGDTDQWYQVDLGKQYFIRDVIIDVGSVSNDENENLALQKTTFGSPNYDVTSSQDNAVDGIHNNTRSTGSCYSSSQSENDPWWMVDLGNTFSISSVAIQHRRDDGYESQHSYLSVIIYDSNPKTDANAEGTTCTEKPGPWGPFVKVPCTRPVTGRYVLIKRMEGAESGVMTLCEVQVFQSIESKLHDFTVNVYEDNPVSVGDAVARRCTTHRGEFPKDERTTLTCAEDVWGRYVRIKADKVRDQYDQMTICEMEVYGDKAVQKGWSSFDCGPPPVLTNAYVSVTHTPGSAIANYTCSEGFATCNGRNTLTCTSEIGWSGTPEACVPTRFSAYDPDGLEIVHFCPLRLGEAVELYFKPKKTNSTLGLGSGSDLILEMKWEKKPRGDVRITTDLTTKQPYPTVFVENLPLAVNKESKIVITVLSNALHIDVGGVSFYSKVKSPHLIDTAWTKNAAMGKLTIETGDTIVASSVDNLALSGRASASSELNNVTNPGRAVDGDQSMEWNKKSCWSTAVGDLDAWWQVELDSLFYVSQVTITTRRNCGRDCNRRSHDFKIEMFHREPSSDESGQLCLQYNGVLPHSTTSTLKCTDIVYGRVLRISAPDRRNTNDLFTLCEVQVFGGQLVKAGEQRNLALFRPAMASSENANVALAGRAVDGNKHFRYISNSCWLAEKGDLNPWWQVELDNFYYVSHVEITSRVDCGPFCGQTIHDFAIEVSPENPTLGLQKELCLQYNGVFPDATTMALKCTKKALGKYVRITSPGRTKPDDKLTLCEVGVYGEEVTIKDATSTNLALDRPVSSSSRQSPPQWAADGNKAMDWAGNSCWSTESDDLHPWWMVELDDYYLVSEVEITSRRDCGKECNERLHSFKVETFYKKPEEGDEGDLCFDHPEPFPHSTTKVLQCKEKKIARFVRLSSPGRKPAFGELTVCEFQVFGAKVRRSAWTPSDCPEPPLLPNACVDISYRADHAVATYTCNTNYSMCTGSSMLYCNGKDGWEGTPGKCLQTTLEVHHGHATDLSEFPICSPKLGEGLEMWITPNESGCTLELLTDYRESRAIQFTITPDNTEEPITVSQLQTGTELNILKPKSSHISLKKESHVVILFLTNGLRVEVDGERLLDDYPHIKSSAKINYVRSSDNLKIRMARPVQSYRDRIVRVENEENLAVGSAVTASSSQENNIAANLIDGDKSQSMHKCWMPDVGATDQSVLLDLGEYYYIREVVIYNRGVDSCTVCDERTRDFVINVLLTENEDELSKVCAVYKGVMPLGAVEKLRCKENVWGRYVKISTDKTISGESDLMTLCEVEVYGDKVINKPWTPTDCPTPRYISDASVQLSYSSNRATATYTCDADYSMCTGSNTLQCTSEVGWEGTVGTCRQTTRELPYGRDSDLGEISICSLKLGEGIELWVLPLVNGGKISLKLDETGNTSIALVISPDQSSGRTQIMTVSSGTTDNEVTVNNMFTLGKETRITIVFLSDNLLILVDGKSLAVYPHHLETPRITFIQSSAGINIRKTRLVTQLLDGIVRVPRDNNLALNKRTIPVSQYNDFDHTNLVDGDVSQIPGEKCWHANIGAEEQWVIIDLGDYFFVRELVLYARGSDCVDCADRTHDFAIDILPNEKTDETTTRCAFYKGIMPQTAEERIYCKDDAWGRYVRISATDIRGPLDLMTFCEVEVYGDAVVDEKYMKCPMPAQIDNGKLTSTGVNVGDVVTLTCNADSRPCGRKLTGVCQENGQWESMATRCDQYRWEAPALPFDHMTPCGDYVQVTYTIKAVPTEETRFSINLKEGKDIILHVDNRLQYQNFRNQLIVDTELSGNWTGLEVLGEVPYKVGQENTVQISYLKATGTYEIIVDGNTIGEFPERKKGSLPDIIQVHGAAKVALVEILNAL